MKMIFKACFHVFYIPSLQGDCSLLKTLNEFAYPFEIVSCLEDFSLYKIPEETYALPAPIDAAMIGSN
jgi:hypothetical protein